MKKTFSIIGMLVGILLVIVGILTMSGVIVADSSSPSSAPTYYDSGYATFGADYYNYSVNNAAEAAAAARSASYNIIYLAEFLSMFFGLTTMLAGMLTICGFGVILATCSKPAPVCIAEVQSDNFSASETYDIESAE